MENKVTARNPITEGCIWKGMLLFALPIMLGSLLQQLYNTADAVIVGRALGKAALASVGGSSARISNLLVNAFVAPSSGAKRSSSRSTSARGTRSACAGASAPLCSFRWSAAFFSRSSALPPRGSCSCGCRPPLETLDASASYLRIFFGMVPTMLYNMGSGILRAMGDSSVRFTTSSSAS